MLCGPSDLSCNILTAKGAVYWGSTWRMGGLENPVGILCVCDQLVVPLDLEVARGLLEERWTGEVVDVKLRRHCRELAVEAGLWRGLVSMISHESRSKKL